MSECEIAITASERAELKPLRDDQPRQDAPMPANEIEGHTVCSLVSPGTELAYNYTGSSYPSFPGYSAVFKAERIGAEVQGVEPGDLLFVMGMHRSYQRLHSRHLVRVPKGLDPAVATLARLMGVSMSTLTTTTARPPAQVIVSGLGPIGNLAAQIFHACGYRVLACDPVESRRKLLAKTGIALAPALPLGDPAYVDKVDLVADCSGHEGAVLDGCKIVKKRGEVVLLGVPWRPRTEITAQALLHTIFHRYVILRSGWEWEVPTEPTPFRNGCILENFAAALDWLNKGRIQTDGFFDVASPADAPRVYADLFKQRAKTLTTVFDWRKM